MTLKTFRPYTKSTRGTVIIAKKELWKGKPIKSLTFGKKSVSGRNNLGRITSRRRGSGHKQKFRNVLQSRGIKIVKRIKEATEDS